MKIVGQKILSGVADGRPVVDGAGEPR